MTEKETKSRLLVSLSGYSTHKKNEVPLDYWLETQDMKRDHPVLSKRYKALRLK